MTQEEKHLLLIDLCGRLPYGVIVQFEGWNPERLLEANLRIDVYNGMGGLPIPYLRPMSSMTEEELAEYERKYVFCVRGWGHLTGTGALHLPLQDAQRIQDGFVQHIAKQLKATLAL